MDDEVTKKGAKLLLEGAKMLATPCPICHNPIYQLQNSQLICVKCNRMVEIVSKAPTKTPTQLEIPRQIVANKENTAINLKIDQLTKQLLEETDPKKIIEIAETIKKLEQIMDS